LYGRRTIAAEAGVALLGGNPRSGMAKHAHTSMRAARTLESHPQWSDRAIAARVAHPGRGALDAAALTDARRAYRRRRAPVFAARLECYDHLDDMSFLSLVVQEGAVMHEDLVTTCGMRRGSTPAV
jgi:hypothetical protein